MEVKTLGKYVISDGSAFIGVDRDSGYPYLSNFLFHAVLSDTAEEALKKYKSYISSIYDQKFNPERMFIFQIGMIQDHGLNIAMKEAGRKFSEEKRKKELEEKERRLTEFAKKLTPEEIQFIKENY